MWSSLARPRLVESCPVGEERIGWSITNTEQLSAAQRKATGMRGCPKALSFHRRNCQAMVGTSGGRGDRKSFRLFHSHSRCLGLRCFVMYPAAIDFRPDLENDSAGAFSDHRICYRRLVRGQEISRTLPSCFGFEQKIKIIAARGSFQRWGCEYNFARGEPDARIQD